MKNILKKLRQKRAKIANQHLCDQLNKNQALAKIRLIKELDRKISKLEKY